MRYNREKKELTFDEAKDKALRLLEFRSHSERELSDKLKIAGAKEEDIDEILEFCRNYGFLDDSIKDVISKTISRLQRQRI